MIEPRVDSSTDIGGARRSTSSTNVHANLMTQSMFVKRPSAAAGADKEGEGGQQPSRLKHGSSQKKSSSVYGLDKNEGKIFGCVTKTDWHQSLGSGWR